MSRQRLVPPDAVTLLQAAAMEGKPVVIVVAGHNGSGKSTFWYEVLADTFQVPLLNADRLTSSILPLAPDGQALRPWAANLRDHDERWQRLSQRGVHLYLDLIMEQQLPFAYETVFSYLHLQGDGTYRSKIDVIVKLQQAGYYVALLFIGLTSAELSILRVGMRRDRGGHDVPEHKLRQRFPRTQLAIRLAAARADLTLMFDNSRGVEQAFTLARAQLGDEVLYDCRDAAFTSDTELKQTASTWLSAVAPR